MKCRICNETKLSNEFPRVTLTDTCDHPPLHCLRCVTSLAKANKKCPYENCGLAISDDNPCLREFEATLEHLFPVLTTTYTPPVDMHHSIFSTVSIVTMTGDSIAVPYKSNMTIHQLKQRIEPQFKVTEARQKLIYNDQELKVYRQDGTLFTVKDYNVQAQASIHLLVLLYSVPETFNHVIFDLHWGYPNRGRDYLDAICLLFSHTNIFGKIAYSSRRSIGIWHSGDVMDNMRRIGHHTIDVKLKELPPSVTHLIFILSAYSSPTIASFPNPSLKFFEASNKTKDLCKTTFSHAGHSQSVVMCTVSRKGGTWEIFNSGKLSAGNVLNYLPLINTSKQLISSGI